MRCQIEMSPVSNAERIDEVGQNSTGGSSYWRVNSPPPKSPPRAPGTAAGHRPLGLRLRAGPPAVVRGLGRDRIGQSADQLRRDPASLRSPGTVVPVDTRQNQGGVVDVHRVDEIDQFGVVGPLVAAEQQGALHPQRLGGRRNLQPITGGKLDVGGLDRTAPPHRRFGLQRVECHREPPAIIVTGWTGRGSSPDRPARARRRSTAPLSGRW